MSKLSELDAEIWQAIDDLTPLPIEAADMVPPFDMVRAVRIAAGLTQQATADLFGYSLRSWQHKEESGEGNRALSVGEWNYLMLIASVHPSYTLTERRRK